MHTNPKKVAVFQLLNATCYFLSLPEIARKLDYAERSVRRWLVDMVEEGLVERTGKKRATKYRAVPKVQRLSLREGFGPESETIVAQVRRPKYMRMPVAYDDEWLEKYQPNKSYYIPLKLRSELHERGKRSKDEAPAGTYAHQIYDRLLIDLSYNSSRLEGNTYSLLDTKKLLLEGKAADGKLDEEKTMILNHKDAIRYLVDHAPRLEITTETICTLHSLLSDGLVERHHAGKIRNHGVYIGGSTYIPFEDPKQLQMRFGKIIQKAAAIQDPFEQSLFLLMHISYLQAFADVNKRTARLSANIPLIKGNFVPLSFNDISKDDYTSAMIAVYELQDVRPILDLYAYSYFRTCSLYESTVKALSFDEQRVRYRAQRRALVREIILNKIRGDTLKKHITAGAKAIPEIDQLAFIQDVHEDLECLDQYHIGGLSLTPEELAAWKEN